MIMINLFSIFDPSTSNYFSLNWLRRLYVLILIPNIYWLIPSRYIYLILIISKTLIYEFIILLNLKLNIFNIIILIRLFYFILLNNFLGIFPYIFTSSRHLVFRLTISLSLWLSIILFGWIKNFNNIFIHLVPQGTPNVLIPFIVLIETIRNIIRPGTLAVRLSANIIAGHLLITLISSTGNSLIILFLIFILLRQCLLIILELSVSIIQAYVFTVLSTLYRAESN